MMLPSKVARESGNLWSTRALPDPLPRDDLPDALPFLFQLRIDLGTHRDVASLCTSSNGRTGRRRQILIIE